MSVEDSEGAATIGDALRQINWPAASIILAVVGGVVVGAQMWGATQETVRQQASYSAQLETRIQRLEAADKELAVVLTQVRVDLAGVEAELRALRLSIDRRGDPRGP